MKLPDSRKGPNHPLLLIEWIDSCSTRGWNPPANISRAPTHCFSVGWLLEETSHVVLLVASAGLTPQDDFDDVAGQITIPKVAIVRRRVLASKRL